MTTFHPRFQDLASWAKSVGSGAKTRAGQRRAVLASFRPIPGMVNLESGRPGQIHTHTTTTRAQHAAFRRRQRQEMFASNHPLVLSSPPPATIRDCTGGLPVWRWDGDTPPRHVCTRLGEWYVRAAEDVAYDRHRYSKTWHARYGAVKVVENRRVLISRVLPDGTLDQRAVPVRAWQGNYILAALVAAGVCKGHKGQMNVRLHSAYDIELVRKARHLTIFRRVLLGEEQDYCAVWHGLTHHARTAAEAVRGLRKAMRAVIERQSHGRFVDLALCRSLGFCDIGVRTFCAEFDLDPRGRYRPDEIERAIVGHGIARAQPYREELSRLAQAVDFDMPVRL